MTVLLHIITVIGSIGLCLLVADFFSGLLHWVEDTWLAPGRSALLDRWIVIDNIEHHRTPGRIRNSSYWETNRVCLALATVAASLLIAAHIEVWQVYLVLALLSQSNQVHKWAHMSQPPRIVAVLQHAGVLQSRTHHGIHHKSPYAARFCTFTNFLNPLLDGAGFWRALESLAQRSGLRVMRANELRFGY
jgi:ubiquitin-conjugating enzyme E2 variant